MQRSWIESERQQNSMQITKKMVRSGIRKRKRKLVRKILITSIIQNYDNYCEKKRRVSNKFVDGRNGSLSAKARLLST